MVLPHYHQSGEFPVGSGARTESEFRHSGYRRQGPGKFMVYLQTSLDSGIRLKRMHGSEPRQGRHLLIDSRIVFHGTASERIKAVVDTEIHARQAGIMTHGIRFAHLRESRPILPSEILRNVPEVPRPAVCRQGASPPSLFGQFENEFIVIFHLNRV